ncbi:MAG: hypothetical protein HOQ43_09335, partial [Glycomyces artemisiae]|nr:hypothetical protein [Glycomyces artemisiae]
MWEPSNEIEHRLREALRAEDQDGYFRILAQIELVLPLSYEGVNGTGADTWATWTTDDRTHILAFTSESALQVCLRDNAGSSRRVTFQSLAEAWPDEEWWLAVNPGLPIEGYLPAWFVSQVAQGMTTVPADPEPPAPPAPEPYREDRFAGATRRDPFGDGQADPFANPIASPQAPPPQRESFMPPPPPIPDVPPAPRRSSDLNGSTGQPGSTVAGTTSAGLPLRQPPREDAEPEGFSAPFQSQQDQSYTPQQDFGSQPQGFGSQPQHFTSQPQGFGSQPQQFSQPQGYGSQPREGAFPAEPHWPSPQDQWPDAPDWLRDQQAESQALPTREPAPVAYPETYSSGDAFGTPASHEEEPPRTAESFASMSSAFGRRPAAPELAPQATAAPQPVEL